MFEKGSSIIRDASRLDYDYVPERLIHREAQMRRMETLFRPLAEYGRSCTAMLTGSVGTGKTATARRFFADMARYCAEAGRPIDVIMVNCRNRSSESAVILQLIRHFDRGFPDRGFSVEEMSRTLRGHLTSNTRNLVVVLDEVDVLLRKGSVDLVYQLTRFSDGTEPSSATVSLAMISQEPVRQLLDEASQSTFRRTNDVTFDRYTEDELREIVTARAEEALIPGRYTEDAMALIAENSAEYGDARLAIELLDRAATIAEEDTVGELNTEHVRAAKAMIFSTVSETKLRSLDANRKAVLLAIARSMKTSLEISLTSAEKTYAVVCEEYGLTPRKHTQIWLYVQDLEKLGIVRTSVRSAGAGGRTTMVSLPDIPSKVLAEKMEGMLEGGGRDEV